MSPPKIISYIAFVVFSVLGALNSAARADEIERPPRDLIVVAGDSRSDVAIGNWARMMWLYDPLFERANVFLTAYQGQTTGDVLKQFDAGVFRQAERMTKAAPRAYFIIWAGVNDALRLKPAPAIVANLRELWKRARQRGFKVVAFPVGPLCAEGAAQRAIVAEADKMIAADAEDYDHFIDPNALLDCSYDRWGLACI